jgi:hypothetical protein
MQDSRALQSIRGGGTMVCVYRKLQVADKLHNLL